MKALDVRTFGARGDGLTDDTKALGAALARAGELGLVVLFPPGTYVTSAGLEAASVVYMMPGASIKPTGSGYTALTIAPNFFSSPWRIVIDSGASDPGGRPAIDGLSWENPAGATVELVRVSGLDGFGFRLNKCWDSTFLGISVELCGSASSYAFVVDAPGSDTCNETHFVRVQVEQAQENAIFVHPNTLNCRFSLIHSERASVSAPTDTWVLGGNRCSYGNVRLQASKSPKDATAYLIGANTSYDGFLSEGPVVVRAECYSGAITVRNPEIQGTFTLTVNQVNRVHVYDGSIAAASGYMIACHFHNTEIATASPSASGGDLRFDGCAIGELLVSANATSTRLDRCVITSATTAAAGTRFSGCTIAELTSDAGPTYCSECEIGTLSNGYATGLRVTGGAIATFKPDSAGPGRDKDLMVLRGVEIGDIVATSNESAVSLYDCRIAAYTSAVNALWSWGSVFRVGIPVHYAGAYLHAGTRIEGNVTLDNGAIFATGLEIIGNLSQSAGAKTSQFDGYVCVTGTVSGIGDSPPNGGTWRVGDRTRRLVSAVGAPKAWTCTAAGTPGTWTSEGNL